MINPKSTPVDSVSLWLPFLLHPVWVPFRLKWKLVDPGSLERETRESMGVS